MVASLHSLRRPLCTRPSPSLRPHTPPRPRPILEARPPRPRLSIQEPRQPLVTPELRPLATPPARPLAPTPTPPRPLGQECRHPPSLPFLEVHPLARPLLVTDILRVCLNQGVAQHQPQDILSREVAQLQPKDILSQSLSREVVATPRALLITFLATQGNSLELALCLDSNKVLGLCLDSSLELVLCLDSSLVPMELPLPAASALTPTAGCSLARVRATPAPLSDDGDNEPGDTFYIDFLYYYVIYDKQNCIIGDYNIYSVMSFYII